VVAAEATDPGAATTHDDAKAVATVSADVSSSATSDVHDKPTGQASDQGHGLETDRDRFVRLDHAGPIRDDEGGKHATEAASDQTAMVPADSQPSVKPQHALPTETTIAPDHSTTFDKADASTGSSAAVTAPSYVVPTAATTAPDVPDAPELKTDIHVNKHGLTLGHDWIQSSRGDWQFNFSWKSDGWSHAADIGISDVHMNMSGANAFHFELPSTTHAASAAGEMFGHANSVHFNEENSGAAQPPVDHFHATLHAAHELMV
jgi:hypothetical protein